MTPKQQQRIASVIARLERVQKTAATHKIALNTEEKPSKLTDSKAMGPVVNNLESTMAALDKMVNGLVAAINRGNAKNAKELIGNVVKAIGRLSALAEKSLSPLTASTSTKRDRVDRSIRRANAIVRRAKRVFSV